MPMIHGISAKWAPPNERGRLVGFVLGGKSSFLWKQKRENFSSEVFQD